MRVLLFTDTLGDVNGVSRFIRNVAAHAVETDRPLTVVTSTRFTIPDQPNLINFAPLFAGAMPGYANLEIALPPVAAMLAFARQHRPDVIHISTPGPVGMVGLLVARMLKIPVVGVYHTDFPAYIERLFGNDSLTLASSVAMRWFYRPFAAVFARSEDYLRALHALGIGHDRTLRLLPGMCTTEFSPTFRDPAMWATHGSATRTVRVLSVGRISVEKNLPILAKVWRTADETLRAQGVDAELVVVGDGPYRNAMEEELQGCRVRFLGFRFDAELATIYASSDLFVFPSTTDTLGQVVMEAQASGLPVLVTNQGGPKEVVHRGRTGFVLSANDLARWVEAIVELVTNPARRSEMSAAAHASMQPHTIAASFDHFWSVHERVHQRRPLH